MLRIRTGSLLLLLFLFAGCKKAIDQLKEDYVVKAMVDGEWAITGFTQNGTDITNDFSGYTFKYHDNPRTVDAKKNGVIEKSGSWDGDAATLTTTANFSGATTPLSLINGSWHIDDSGWTYVVATQTAGSTVKTMRLDKQ